MFCNNQHKFMIFWDTLYKSVCVLTMRYLPLRLLLLRYLGSILLNIQDEKEKKKDYSFDKDSVFREKLRKKIPQFVKTDCEVDNLDRSCRRHVCAKIIEADKNTSERKGDASLANMEVFYYANIFCDTLDSLE